MEQELATILVAEITGVESSDDTGGSSSHKNLDYHILLLDRLVTNHNGKLLGNAGDSLAARFTNASDAVRCAVALEDEISTFSGEQNIRIGVDQGEIVVEDGQVRGDGLKSATELQKRVDGTGIYISRSAHDQIDSNDSLEIEQVNEGSDVVFRVRAKASGDNAPTTPMPVRHVWRNASFVAGLAVVLIILAAVTWQGRFTYDFEPADLTKYEFELPEKPSIAVLPFDNLSGDASYDYIGDGLTENIIATLAQVPKLFVIARNSVFTYKGRPVKVQEVAEHLGVRYVMEGSIQKEGSRTRVVAQLVDALDGKHLWAERYDYDYESILELQDAIAQKILEELEVALAFGEQARLWRNEWKEAAATPEEFRMIIDGRVAYQKWTIDDHPKAERLWREVFDRYPETGQANELMGWIYYQKARLGIGNDPVAAFKQARAFSDKMLQAWNGKASATGFLLMGTLDLFEGNHDAANTHVESALELKPNGATVNYVAGWINSNSGLTDLGAERIRLGMRLEPNYPTPVAVDLSRALMKLGRLGEAKAIAQSILESEGNAFQKIIVRYQLTAISVWENDLPGARQFMKEILRLHPNANLRESARFQAIDIDRDFVTRMLNALRRAGLPENPPGDEGG